MTVLVVAFQVIFWREGSSPRLRPPKEGMAEEILGKAFAAGGVVGGHGFFAAVVDIEAGVFPSEEVGEFAGLDRRAGTVPAPRPLRAGEPQGLQRGAGAQ
jgi:hypothetical protein